MNDELTIIGTPVYAGRVPPEAVRRLRRIKGNNTPAVVVVVYGLYQEVPDQSKKMGKRLDRPS